MNKQVTAELKQILDKQLGSAWAESLQHAKNEQELSERVAKIFGPLVQQLGLLSANAENQLHDWDWFGEQLRKKIASGYEEWKLPNDFVETWQMKQPFGVLFFRLPSQVVGTFFCDLIQRYYSAEKRLRLVSISEHEWVLFISRPARSKHAEIAQASMDWLMDHAEGILEMVRMEAAIELRIVFDSAKQLIVAENGWDARDLVLFIAGLLEVSLLVGKLEEQSEIIFAGRYGLERLLMKLDQRQREEWLRQMDPNNKWSGIFDADRELIRTLNVFWQTRGNLSEAAKKLYVHRNTLQYRLDKLKNETGFDPRIAEEAVLVRIGLVLLTLNKNGM